MRPLQPEIHRIDPEFGSTLRRIQRDFQTNCWVNLRTLGQPSEFYLCGRSLRPCEMSLLLLKKKQARPLLPVSLRGSLASLSGCAHLNMKGILSTLLGTVPFHGCTLSCGRSDRCSGRSGHCTHCGLSGRRLRKQGSPPPVHTRPFVRSCVVAYVVRHAYVSHALLASGRARLY
jgi:hypothetical protein